MESGTLTTNILAEPAYYASPANKFEHNPQKAVKLWMRLAGKTATEMASGKKMAPNCVGIPDIDSGAATDSSGAGQEGSRGDWFCG